MIEQILDAGRMAPIGCNLGHLRFVVLKEPEEKRLIWSDISTENAAADHMLLMAHALRLGAVWLSSLKETEKTEDTGERFKREYGLPDYPEVDLHIALGWTSIGSIKSARPPLEDLVIQR